MWADLQEGIRQIFHDAARFTDEDTFTAYAVWAENIREKQRGYDSEYRRRKRLRKRRTLRCKLSPAQMAEVVTALRAGATATATAKKYGVSRTFVWRHAGVRMPMGRPRI